MPAQAKEVGNFSSSGINKSSTALAVTRSQGEVRTT
jgi:hypothetical protein